VEIIKRYQVGKIIYESGNPPTAILQILLATARKWNLPILVVLNTAQISLERNCALTLLNPHILKIKADENNSLVTKLDCAGQKFLFSGDNSSTVEKALLAAGWDVQATVLKASHHGSQTANSAAFLAAVQPKLLVISVGADNKFGHPSPSVLKRASDLNISVQRTDQAGNIRVFSP
jgi:competence protein ComEC